LTNSDYSSVVLLLTISTLYNNQYKAISSINAIQRPLGRGLLEFGTMQLPFIPVIIIITDD